MSPIDPEAVDPADQADMARLMAGQDAALNDLMERHAGALLGFLTRFVDDEDAANDLAQETFLRVYQNRASFKPGMRFSRWLFTIAGNLARNHLRHRARRPDTRREPEPGTGRGDPLDRLPADGPAPDEYSVLAEHHREVRSAVAALPDELREAVVLCELEELTLNEAAAILETTAKAVESRLYRARRQLRHRLSRLLEVGRELGTHGAQPPPIGGTSYTSP